MTDILNVSSAELMKQITSTWKSQDALTNPSFRAVVPALAGVHMHLSTRKDVFPDSRGPHELPLAKNRTSLNQY